VSQEQVLAFTEHIKSTPALRDELTALGNDVEGVVALGAQEGFTFSAADVGAVLQSKTAGTDQPLSDQELEQVAGGTLVVLPTRDLICVIADSNW